MHTLGHHCLPDLFDSLDAAAAVASVHPRPREHEFSETCLSLFLSFSLSATSSVCYTSQEDLVLRGERGGKGMKLA